jgi:hypothetical protein
MMMKLPLGTESYYRPLSNEMSRNARKPDLTRPAIRDDRLSDRWGGGAADVGCTSDEFCRNIYDMKVHNLPVVLRVCLTIRKRCHSI